MSMTYEMEGFGGRSADLSLFGDLTFEEMAKKALNEVRGDVESCTKAAISASIRHSGPSELISSIKTFDPYMTKDGTGAKLTCTFTGRSSSGNRYNNNGRSHLVYNNDKAFWLEYGTVKQAARPWRDRAMNNAERIISPKIEDAIGKALGAE